MIKYTLQSILFVFLFATAFAEGGEKPEAFQMNYQKHPAQTAGFSDIVGKITQGMSIGAGVGLMVPYGDLAPYKVFPKMAQRKTHFHTGYNVYLERDIKWGLGARAQFQKGQLKSERQTDIAQVGPLFASKVQFHNYSLQIRFDITDVLFKSNEYRKFYVSGFAGAGIMYYRSYTFIKNRESRWVYQAYGYETDKTPERIALTGKAKMQTNLYIPVTFRFGYRYNYKTDLYFEMSLNNTTTDQFDGFDRSSFTAKDKYGFFGIGMTYNFGRSEEDLPKKEEDKGEEGGIGEIDDVKVAKRRGILGIGRKKSGEKMDLKLRMFDNQLRLLEMQYLDKE